MASNSKKNYAVVGKEVVLVEEFANSSTGAMTQIIDKCGSDCALIELLDLKIKYINALANYNYLVDVNKNKLKMAHYTRKVCESASKNSNGAIKESDVWSSMWNSSREKPSSSCDDTFLKKYIDHIELDIIKAKQKAEDYAKSIINFLEDEDVKEHFFSKHAVDFTGDLYIPEDKAQSLYNIDKSKGEQKVREIDFIMSYVTEDFFVVDAGLAFLEEIINESSYSKYAGIKEVWSFIKDNKSRIQNGKVCIEPIGKLFYNALPVVKNKIDRLVLQKRATLDQVLDSQELIGFFSFLKNYLDADIKSFIRSRSKFFGSKATSAISDANQNKSWQFVLDSTWGNQLGEFYDKDFALEMKKHSTIKKLEGSWFNLAFDTISLAISVAQIAADFRKVKIKDWCSALSDLHGLASSGLEVHGLITTQKSLAASGDDVYRLGLKANKALGAAKVFGVAAAVFSAVVCAISTQESIEQGDVDAAFFNALGLGIAVGGIISAVVGATLLCAIFAVAGIIVGIIITLVTDKPVINFLKNTYWGINWPADYNEHKKPYGKSLISIKEITKEYYKRLYTIKVTYKDIYKKVKNTARIRIQSHAVNGHIPLYIEVYPQNRKPTKNDRKIIIHSINTVEGKGHIERPVSTLTVPSIFIYRYWEIWKIKKNVKYIIQVGIDPDIDKPVAETLKPIDKMVLNDRDDNINFALQ